jgi:hypothetical protein
MTYATCDDRGVIYVFYAFVTHDARSTHLNEIQSPNAAFGSLLEKIERYRTIKLVKKIEKLSSTFTSGM